jgi:hypothetical protein
VLAELPMTNWEIIRWWEIRRIPYNVLLFIIGIAAIFAMEGLMGRVIPLGEDAVEPFALALGSIAFGIIVNLCYTFGWVIELRRTRIDSVSARRRGERMFLTGLWFSCLLASAPFWFGFIFWFTSRPR